MARPAKEEKKVFEKPVFNFKEKKEETVIAEKEDEIVEEETVITEKEDKKETKKKSAKKEEKEVAEKEDKNFNLEIFSIFKKFSDGDKDMDSVWVNEDGIMSTKQKVKSLYYNPQKKIFKNEFGVGNLSNFISLLSIFDSIELEFDSPILVFKDKKNSSILTYRSASKESFDKKIESNNKALNLHDVCKKLISNDDYFKFHLSSETIGKIKRVGNCIAAATQKPSILSFIKTEKDNDVMLQIRNEDSENTYNIEIAGENKAGIENINKSIHIHNLLEGNWEVYLFDSSIEHLGQKIPIVWTFMVDIEKQLELLIIFINDSKK